MINVDVNKLIMNKDKLDQQIKHQHYSILVLTVVINGIKIDIILHLYFCYYRMVLYEFKDDSMGGSEAKCSNRCIFCISRKMYNNIA